jgi:hypothetical protein
MVRSQGVRQERMDAAVASFGIDGATGWGVDLNGGTFRFELPDGELVGSAQLVGVFTKIGKTWTWGWAADLPETVRELATATREWARDAGYDILLEPVVSVTEMQADGLAALTFARGEGTLLYRAFGPAADTYVSVRFTDVVDRASLT